MRYKPNVSPVIFIMVPVVMVFFVLFLCVFYKYIDNDGLIITRQIIRPGFVVGAKYRAYAPEELENDFKITPADYNKEISINISDSNSGKLKNAKGFVRDKAVVYQKGYSSVSFVPTPNSVIFDYSDLKPEQNGEEVILKIPVNELIPYRCRDGTLLLRDPKEQPILKINAFDVDEKGKVIEANKPVDVEFGSKHIIFKSKLSTIKGIRTMIELEDVSDQPAVTVKGEIKSMRTLTSKTYLMSDGSHKREHVVNVVEDIAGRSLTVERPLFYENCQGKFSPIEIGLVEDAELAKFKNKVNTLSRDSYGEVSGKLKAYDRDYGSAGDMEDACWYALKTPYYAAIPKKFNRGYTIKQDCASVEFIPQGTSSKTGAERPGQGSVVKYGDAWKDTDVLLDAQPDKLKEYIIAKSSASPEVFTYELQGRTEGLLFESAYLVDAVGQKRKVNQILRNEGGKTYLDIKPVYDGLKFPVVIDPTIHFHLHGNTHGVSDTDWDFTTPEGYTAKGTYTVTIQNEFNYSYGGFGELMVPIGDSWSPVTLNQIYNDFMVINVRAIVNGQTNYFPNPPLPDLDPDVYIDTYYNEVTFSGDLAGFKEGDNHIRVWSDNFQLGWGRADVAIAYTYVPVAGAPVVNNRNVEKTSAEIYWDASPYPPGTTYTI
ncbi:hypothetical protein, partial [Desulfocucumis palustris]|uniref:hypothetical protein n=1 Tax=Desulfocucumis palustris TaxID=1898651 RepID=UPI0010575B4A